jgi:hypothetical protein
LDEVLWAYRYTPKVAINISSYELAFGMDAVTSMKTLLHSPRVMLYEEVGNTEGKSVAVELVQERRSEALRRMIEYQRKMRLAFDQRVSPEVFSTGRSRPSTRGGHGQKGGQVVS